MQTIKRYYIGINPPRLVEITPAYLRDTGANGLVKGEDYDAMARRVDLLQERLNVAEEFRPCAELACRRLEENRKLRIRNNRLFLWSCLGYLLALGCLTYIFATGSI